MKFGFNLDDRLNDFEISSAMQSGRISAPIVNTFHKKIPQTIAVLNIDGNGNLIEKIVSKSAESEFGHSELEYIGKLIGLRYLIVDFPKILPGLEMTVNVFRNRCVFVTQIAHDSFIAVITKNVDIEKTRHTISQIKETLFAH